MPLNSPQPSLSSRFQYQESFAMISKDWRANLHAFLGGIVKDFKGVPLAIGGIKDHVHLLVGLRTTHRLDYVLRDIKADSSSWVHDIVGKELPMASRLSWCHGSVLPKSSA